jgi:bifunctional enzyme CysN/CysC
MSDTPTSASQADRREDYSSEAYLNMDLLRFTTAGSVDDGKSTLIGRLLYDSKSIFEDQYEAIELSSRSSGEEGVNLALLTDGLRAEREQKITIDVAYRYFATPKRKFIIADTPGHTQYTRNMVTGASTADLAIILVDARKGVITQSKRHSFISSLLQIPHMIVAVNKMDLVDYSEERFNEIVRDFQKFSQKLEIDDITYLPISALNGDNIVHKGENMPWYDGGTLLYTLEHVNVGSRRNLVDFRYPVQYVVRPNQDFRGFAGTIASGVIRPGEEVTALPSMKKSTVKEVWVNRQTVDEAAAGESAVLTLNDEVDISRGDMLVRSHNLPHVSNEFEAFVCWMNDTPMQCDKRYDILHTSKLAQIIPDEVHYKFDIDTMHRQDADHLELNEIGRIRFTTSAPIFFDPYKNNNATGSFIIIDPATHVTVGAGMILAIQGDGRKERDTAGVRGGTKTSPNVVWEPWNITREERQQRNGHKPAVLWFTGISGAGKSTIARAVERKLWEQSCQTMMLDGDQVRHGLNGDLGFSDADRAENIRRVAHLARLFFEHGNIVLSSFISPFRVERDMARQLIDADSFFEVHVDCSVDEARKRDPKGLYKKVDAGEIRNFTGVDSPYEAPEKPEIHIDTAAVTPEQAVDQVLKALRQHGIL